MATPLHRELLQRFPSQVVWRKKTLRQKPACDPSFTALLVALARRKADPLGLELILTLEGYREKYERHLENFALRQGIPLLPHLSLEDKHFRLLRYLASDYFDAFYEGRIGYVDSCIDTWRTQNRLMGKKSVILLMGAGFDTKSLRYPPDADLLIVEFDTPQTQALKHQALESLTGNRMAPGVAYIPVDYTRTGEAQRQLHHALLQVKSRFPDTAPEDIAYFVSLEGLSYYLDEASNRQLFALLMDSLPTGTRCFADWYDGTRWNPEIHPYGRFLQSLGEPVRFSPADYPAAILYPLSGGGKGYREIQRTSRAQVAADRMLHHTGRQVPGLRDDPFGDIAWFSLVEIIEKPL